MKKRKDMSLKSKYDKKTISSEEFLFKLFNSNEADRTRRRIVSLNKKLKGE